MGLWDGIVSVVDSISRYQTARREAIAQSATDDVQSIKELASNAWDGASSYVTDSGFRSSVNENIADGASEVFNRTTNYVGQVVDDPSIIGDDIAYGADVAGGWIVDQKNTAIQSGKDWVKGVDQAHSNGTLPEYLGKSVGEVEYEALKLAAEAGAAYLSGGSSVAARRAIKEGAEEVLETAVSKGVRSNVDDALIKGQKVGDGDCATGICPLSGVAKKVPDSAPLAVRGSSEASKLRMAVAPDGEIIVDGTRISSAANSNIKGNFGETMADSWAAQNGMKKVNGPASDIGDKITKGIDGVYSNPNPPPGYIIGEAKFGTSQLSTLKDGTKQMSDEWIQRNLTNAVGPDLADEILLEGYERVILKVDKFGNVVPKPID